MQTNPAVEQNKTVVRIESVRTCPVGEKRVYDGKDLPNSLVLSLEWTTEHVRKDESGDSKDCKYDELSCIMEMKAKETVSDKAREGQ